MKKLYSLTELFEQFENNQYNTDRLSDRECLELLSDNDVIIYGAGNSGIVLYERLKQIGIKTYAFWDNNGSIYGDEYNGTNIYNSNSIAEVLRKDRTYVVIVALFDIMSYPSIKQSVESIPKSGG